MKISKKTVSQSVPLTATAILLYLFYLMVIEPQKLVNNASEDPEYKKLKQDMNTAIAKRDSFANIVDEKNVARWEVMRKLWKERKDKKR